MRKCLILLAFFAVLFSGCQDDAVYTYRYRAGTMQEYQNLMASWVPNNSTPQPLPPSSKSTVSGWVLESSEGDIIPLGSDNEPLIINKNEYGEVTQGVLVSTKILVNDPYTNTSHYKQAYYLSPPSYYYYDSWPYHYGRPYYPYGYGRGYGYGYGFRRGYGYGHGYWGY